MNEPIEKRPPSQATTFRQDEIELASALFAKGSTGADVTIMLRSAAAQRLHQKFVNMRARLREAEREGARP